MTTSGAIPGEVDRLHLALEDWAEVVLYPAARLLCLRSSQAPSGGEDPALGHGLLLVRAAGHAVADGFVELDQLHLACGSARWELSLVAEVGWTSEEEGGCALLLCPTTATGSAALGSDDQFELRGSRGRPLVALPSPWRDVLLAPTGPP